MSFLAVGTISRVSVVLLSEIHNNFGRNCGVLFPVVPLHAPVDPPSCFLVAVWGRCSQALSCILHRLAFRVVVLYVCLVCIFACVVVKGVLCLCGLLFVHCDLVILSVRFDNGCNDMSVYLVNVTRPNFHPADVTPECVTRG